MLTITLDVASLYKTLDKRDMKEAIFEHVMNFKMELKGF